MHCSFPETPVITTTTKKKTINPSSILPFFLPLVSPDFTISPLPQSHISLRDSSEHTKLFHGQIWVSRWQICHFWGQPCHIYRSRVSARDAGEMRNGERGAVWAPVEWVSEKIAHLKKMTKNYPNTCSGGSEKTGFTHSLRVRRPKSAVGLFYIIHHTEWQWPKLVASFFT